MNEIQKNPLSDEKLEGWTEAAQSGIIDRLAVTVPMMIPAVFDRALAMAEVMAMAATLPESLRGATHEETRANCVTVVAHCLSWGLNPLMAVTSFFLHKGSPGIEGKLAAAIAANSPAVDGRLRFEYAGEGNGLSCKCSGRIAGEEKDREITLTIEQVKKMASGPIHWISTNVPEQKLAYVCAAWWLRRHAPELLFGAIISEEIDFDAGKRQAKTSGPQRPSDIVEAVILDPVETSEDEEEEEEKKAGDSEDLRIFSDFVDLVEEAESPEALRKLSAEVPSSRLTKEEKEALKPYFQKRHAELKGGSK